MVPTEGDNVLRKKKSGSLTYCLEDAQVSHTGT